jgi:tRNA-Thr(GGU) m(6)t(6)A37 methyltransferase TsaA
MHVIAHVYSDFPEKFGIPRQSGLVKELQSRLVFEPEYRNPDAVRGLEQFSHIWLIWNFSASPKEAWSPTVRPPRLGGNRRIGVFASRSPFRPNPLGLSCVKLERIEYHPEKGPVLYLSGADLLNGTPVYDIKPYLPYVDCHPEAQGGFTETVRSHHLAVEIPEPWLQAIPEDKRGALAGVLASDPRPAYQDDPERIYGFCFAGMEVKFTVKDGKAKVCGIFPERKTCAEPVEREPERKVSEKQEP